MLRLSFIKVYKENKDEGIAALKKNSAYYIWASEKGKMGGD